MQHDGAVHLRQGRSAAAPSSVDAVGMRDPYCAICAIAISSTTRTMMASRYSVYQSCSVAGLTRVDLGARLIARTSQPASSKDRSTAGCVRRTLDPP